jgi:site-specific recombinase XerC
LASPEGTAETLHQQRPRRSEAFLGDLLTRRAAATAWTRYKALRILYRWLEEEDEIAANPMAKMKPPIIPEQPVPVVPEDGLRRLASCAGKRFEDRRDTALILLLVDVGPRRAELMGLTVADVDFDLDVLLVLARAAGSGPCRLVAEARWCWTVTYGSASAIRMLGCRGCG